MKYMKLYNDILNPLDDQNTLEQLIKIYSEGSDFYTSIMRTTKSKKNNDYDQKSYDNFHASMFNAWKKGLLSITTAQYEQAIKQGIYQKDIYKLVALLKKTPDINTYEEEQDFYNRSYADKEIDSAIDKYRWDASSLYSEWTHIQKGFIDGKKTKPPKIEHRFYINAHLKDIHKLSKIFMDKCIAYNIPFYFKIAEVDRRDDSIVIYSSTELIPQYCMIFDQIEEEYPNLVKNLEKPPILSGVLNGWVGYGSEPTEGKLAFNKRRANFIEQAITDELIEWYEKNQNVPIIEQGTKKSLTDYLSEQVIKEKLEQVVTHIKTVPQERKLGYSEEDIKSEQFLKILNKTVKENLPRIYEDIIHGGNEKPIIIIPVKKGVNISIYSYMVKEEMKKFITVIKDYDPDFINRIKNRIKNNANLIGADPNKYCFDIETVVLLQQAEQRFQQKKTSNIFQKTQSTESRQSVDYQTPSINYKEMSEEEILAARLQIGEYNIPSQQDPIQSKKIESEPNYEPMTEEEILNSQRKLELIPMVKSKYNKKTTN